MPKGTVRPLVTTIREVAWAGNDQTPTARATITPDGRLAVLASPPVHAGIERLVGQIAQHPPTYDQTVELHFFLVVGRPSATPSPPPPGASEIQPALDEITRSQGAQSFTIQERVRLSSLQDEEGRVDGGAAGLEIRQKAVQTSEGVYASVTIRLKEAKIETRVRLAPDQIVVLGATGAHGEGMPEGATLYYVVRVAPRADGPRP